MATRRHACIRIIRHLGLNSIVIAGLLCLSLESGAVGNFVELYNAARVANGLPEKTLGPSCRNPYGRKPFVRRNPYIDYAALFVGGERRPLSADMSKDEKDVFNSVGGIQVGEYVATANLTQCNNVVTTAAHAFYDKSGVEIPNGVRDAIILLPGGKPSGYKIKDIVTGGFTHSGNQDTVNDWAVICLDDKIETKKYGIKPFAVPEGALDLGNLGSSRLVSVALNHDVEGSDKRRMSDCPRAQSVQRRIDPSQIGLISFNYCNDTGNSSGSAVVALDGPNKFTFVEMNVASALDGAKMEQQVPADKTHYNVAIPVVGRFRQAILDACKRCEQPSKDATEVSSR